MVRDVGKLVLQGARKQRVWFAAVLVVTSAALLIAVCETLSGKRNFTVPEPKLGNETGNQRRNRILTSVIGRESDGWTDSLSRVQPKESLAKLFLTADWDNKALCLDGSSGAFYVSPSPVGSRNWIIVQEWGGWCTVDVPLGKVDDEHTVDNCYTRSLYEKGTSSHLPPTKAGLGGAYLSRSPEDNPTMYDWNIVYIHNCDGTSFVGRLEEPLLLEGDEGPKQIFIRGAYIREAMSAMLKQQHGMDRAETVVIGGMSAGGLAVMLHIDWWGKQLPYSLVLGLVDSGFFLEWHVENNGTHSHQYYVQSYRDQMRLLYQRFNGQVNEACVSHWHAASGAAWECMFASNLWPFIEHDLFIRQSVFDSWQLVQELGSTSDEDAANSYGAKLGQAVKDFVLKAAAASGGFVRHAAFLDACSHHCGFWEIQVNGVTPNAALGEWVASRLRGAWAGDRSSRGAEQPAIIEQAGVYPCPECCGNNSGR